MTSDKRSFLFHLFSIVYTVLPSRQSRTYDVVIVKTNRLKLFVYLIS